MLSSKIVQGVYLFPLLQISLDKGGVFCYNVYMKHPMRNDSGQRYTRALFWEMIQEVPVANRPFKPPYTLHGDREGYVNLQRVYVELGDPTGYKLSQLYLENYDHWLFLSKTKWFKEAKIVWDLELDAKLKAEAMTTIRAISDGIEGVPASVTLSAAKFLANSEHRKTPSSASGRGRPSKEEVQGALKEAAREESDLANDLARIRAVK